MQRCDRYGEAEGVDALNALARTGDGGYAFAGYVRNFPGPYGWLVETDARGYAEREWLDENSGAANSPLVADGSVTLAGTLNPRRPAGDGSRARQR